MEIQWALVIFTVFASLAAGMFAALGVAAWYGKCAKLQMPGTIIAIVAFAVGGGVSALHLGHPERIFGGFSNLQSGVTRELIAFVIIGIIMVVYLVTLYRKAAISKALAALAVLSSAGTVIVFADSYLMPARPVWNTVLLPATYLSSAGVLGLFTLNILAAKQQEEGATLTQIRKATLVALVVQSVVLLCYLGKIVIAPFPDTSRSLSRLLMGDLSPVFWLLVVLVGLLLPYLILTGKAIKDSGKMFQLASTGLVCAVIGGTAFRALLYVMGTTVFKF